MAEISSREGIILNAITFVFDNKTQIIKIKDPIDVTSIDIIDGKVTVNFTYKSEDTSMSAKKFFDFVQELIEE